MNQESPNFVWQGFLKKLPSANLVTNTDEASILTQLESAFSVIFAGARSPVTKIIDSTSEVSVTLCRGDYAPTTGRVDTGSDAFFGHCEHFLEI